MEAQEILVENMERRIPIVTVHPVKNSQKSQNSQISLEPKIELKSPELPKTFVVNHKNVEKLKQYFDSEVKNTILICGVEKIGKNFLVNYVAKSLNLPMVQINPDEIKALPSTCYQIYLLKVFEFASVNKSFVYIRNLDQYKFEFQDVLYQSSQKWKFVKLVATTRHPRRIDYHPNYKKLFIDVLENEEVFQLIQGLLLNYAFQSLQTCKSIFFSN